MPLFEPDYWCLVTEQQYASLRPSHLSVPRMVVINKLLCQHVITSIHWIIPWYHFTDILVKLRPVTILETVLIYGRMLQVKTQFPLWVRLQVPNYVKILINLSNAWHGMTWEDNLTEMTSIKVCQHVQFSLPNKAGQ